MEPPPDDLPKGEPGGVATAAADDVEDILPQATGKRRKRKRKRKGCSSQPSTSATSDAASAPEDHTASKRAKLSHDAAGSQEMAPSASDTPPPVQQAQLAPSKESATPSSDRVKRSPLPQQTISYPGTIIIDEEDASIEEGRRVCKLHEPDGQIYMFTDGSTCPGEGSGIGIVYRCDTRTDDWAEISQSLPDTNDSCITEAKALAVGIQFFGMDFGADPAIKGLTVLLDSATVLGSLMNYDVNKGRGKDDPEKLGWHVQQIHKQTEIVVSMGKTVTLRWVKAHGKGDKRVEGNARADELAKSANPWKEKKKRNKAERLLELAKAAAQRAKKGIEGMTL
ncbi:hypothetical protein DIS24_g8885 [Lasiodiplodia hormozganensis]|uniref:RNase H type-1 domain-containing protein n=1 Tax=Lasiodiplodia hormozganensis TaxID=869390 RepID=A0AA39XYD6_9PEZI|nr:hypothetical protein DIS24_g8885 [Lasiodiplodia hormozganensis]